MSECGGARHVPDEGPDLMSELRWYFEPVPQMGGAAVAAYRNALAGVGIPGPDLFVRESIQNSVDASVNRESGKVTVIVKTKDMAGDALGELRDYLGFREGEEIFDRQDKILGNGASGGGSLRDELSDSVRCLYLEDFGTKGLGGTIQNIAATSEDNYHRLCLEIGSTGKDEQSGGTFGFGKGVYWVASKIWTIVLYSRFQGSGRTSGATSRLISVSWFDKHTWSETPEGEEIEFTGRAWRGVLASDEKGHVARCEPLVDADADAIATRLGFETRRPGDTGTSILIIGVDDSFNVESLREGIENSWWPRLLSDRLDVRFYEDGSSCPGPAPESRAGLRRFIRSWRLIHNTQEVEGQDVVTNITFKRRALGRFAMTAVDVEDDAGEEIFSDESKSGQTKSDQRKAWVALIRSPLMVVDNINCRDIAHTEPLAHGVFIADPIMNKALAASEPIAHSRWDYKTTRRDRHLDDQDRMRIQKIYEKCKIEAREFLVKHREAPPEPPPRCEEMEKLLGRYIFVARQGPPPPPPPNPDQFEVRLVEQPSVVESEDGHVVDCRARVGIRSGAVDVDEVVCRVRSWLHSVVDQSRSGERIEMMHITATDPDDGDVIVGDEDGRGPYVDVLLAFGGEPITVDLRSAPLPDPEYRFKFFLECEELT